MNGMSLIIWTIVILSVALFSMMGADKRLAKKGSRSRIAEATLFQFAILGGAVGGMAGMYVFRHKTRHLRFQIGFPLLAGLHVLLLIWVGYRN